MDEPVFTDEENAPGEEEIRAALSRSRAAWKRLREFLAESYGLDGEWIYYGRKYGWVVRYRKGGRALTTLSPYKGYFTVQIVLGEADTGKARQAELGENTREALEAAHAYHDGRWLSLEVKSLKDLDDVKTLLAVKRKPTPKKPGARTKSAPKR